MAQKGTIQMKRKGELRRLSLICTAIEVLYQPTKDKIMEFVNSKEYSDKMDGYICKSQIEKDIFTLRNEFSAPIVYSKVTGAYSYEDFDYKFWKALLIYLSDYVEFPTEITKILFD